MKGPNNAHVIGAVYIAAGFVAPIPAVTIIFVAVGLIYNLLALMVTD
jgi:hypothetical protein